MLANVLDPLYQVMGAILAAIYSVVPSYAVAIFGLTLIVLAILTPLTLKGLRSTIKIQKLLPEQKRLQALYKDDRQALNEAIMALYKENKVSPVGGCLPFLVQSPFFIALFGVLRGMTRTHYFDLAKIKAQNLAYGVDGAGWKAAQFNVARGKSGPADSIAVGLPQHLPKGSKLYESLYGISKGQRELLPSLDGVPKELGHRAGELKSFGFDLARSASETASKGFSTFLPYLALMVAMVGLQFLAQQQINKRNPQAAAANPQMQAVTKVMPFLFGVWGWFFQAGLTLYWTTSSALRIVQQWALYRFDPTLAESVKEKKAALVKDVEAKGKAAKGGGKGGPGGGAKATGGAKPGPKGGQGGGASKPPLKPAAAGPKAGVAGGQPARGTARQQPKKQRKGR